MNISQTALNFNFFYEHADVRIRDKLFMGSPYAIVSVYLCLAVFISKIFPKFMEDRKPVSYRKFMSFVDVILFIRSGYFLINAAYLWLVLYNWSCQPIDRSDSWLSKYELRLTYEFVVTKFIYFLQCVVTVACKRKTSIGTYLLIHHTVFPLILWTGANFYPGGHSTFIGFINPIVHFTGATMRIVSAIFHRSAVRKFSKLLDVYMHIFQFTIIMVHGIQLLFLQYCDVPKALGYLEIISAIFIASIYNHYVLNSRKRRQSMNEKLIQQV